MYNSILPSVSSRLEKSFEKVSRYFNDLPVLIKDTTIAENCPESFLPFLAWMLSISDEEGWKFAEGSDAKRNLIKRSIEIHKKKGTVWSIREVFRMLGLGEIEILENVGRLFYNGEHLHDAEMIYGGDFSSTWATYNIRLQYPITNDQAITIRRILDGVAPARSELVRLDYKAVAIRYNAIANYDGQFNYGSS